MSFTNITPPATVLPSGFFKDYLGSSGSLDYFNISGHLLSYDGSGTASDDTPTEIAGTWRNMELIAVDAGQAYITISSTNSGVYLFETTATRGPVLSDITPTGVGTGAPWVSIQYLGASGENRYFEFTNSDYSEYHIYAGDGRVVPTAVQMQESAVATAANTSVLWIAILISATLGTTAYRLRRKR